MKTYYGWETNDEVHLVQKGKRVCGIFFFSSRRRHTRFDCDWSSDVCSSDLERVSALGFEVDELEFNRVFEEFKALADKKKELFDGDIEALVLRSEGSASGPWTLIELATEARSNCPARALVLLEHSDGRSVELSASGDGPVDAAFKAIAAATGIAVVLRKFEVHAVSEGEDAQGEARVYVEYNHRTYRGASVRTNIVESGTRSVLEVINRIELAQAGARVREERSATTPAATTPA